MSFLCPIIAKDANKTLAVLISLEVLFCIIYLADFLLGQPSWWIHDLFDLDGETNIPAWFSTIQLFIIGYMILLIGCHDNHHPPPSKVGTNLIGLGFIFLSMDEASSIHEKLTWVFYNNPMVPYFDGRHGVWIVVYGCIAIILILFLHKDIWAVWKAFRLESLIFILGMFIYLFGSAGMETLTFFYLDEKNPLLYTFEVVIEEFLEMSGASILLYSVLLLAIKKSNKNPSVTT